jgi:ABC-type transport system substrate-binding protein
MFEGLVKLKPGTTKIVPALATTWWVPRAAERCGRSRSAIGVKFHVRHTVEFRGACYN